MDSNKRPLAPSSPTLAKKAKLEYAPCCAFCWFSKSKTRDEGELVEFTIKQNKIYVHESCLLFSGRKPQEQDESIVKRVTTRPAHYRCKAEKCLCRNRAGATIGCCNGKCRQVFHYRCALLAGSMLPSGHFYCVKHHADSEEITKGIKKDLSWPGDVPYRFDNDWSLMSKEDMKLIESSTVGWDTWCDFHSPCVRVEHVTPAHWAWTEKFPYDLKATEYICPERAICELVGIVRKIDTRISNPDQYTDLYLPDPTVNKFMAALTEGQTKRVILDSSTTGNEGRYVNFLTPKARELNLKANARLTTVWSMGKLKGLIVAVADIEEGESIILDDADVFNQSNGTTGGHKIRNQTQNTLSTYFSDDEELEYSDTTFATYFGDADMEPTFSALSPPNSPQSQQHQQPSKKPINPPADPDNSPNSNPSSPSSTNISDSSQTTPKPRYNMRHTPNKTLSGAYFTKTNYKSKSNETEIEVEASSSLNNSSDSIEKKTNTPKSRTPNSRGKKGTYSSSLRSSDKKKNDTNIVETTPNENENENENENNTNINNNNNNNNANGSDPKAIVISKFAPGTEGSIVDDIVGKMLGIRDQYKVDLRADIDLDVVPTKFFYELQKLESVCSAALRKELHDHQEQMRVAKNVRLALESGIETAETPEAKEKIKANFAAIENELAKKEHNLLLEDLQKLQNMLRRNLQRAIGVIAALHEDIKLSSPE